MKINCSRRIILLSNMKKLALFTNCKKVRGIQESSLSGDIQEKCYIIGSIFGKYIISENLSRTTIINEAALLIYQINKGLGSKKARVRTNSGLVPRAGIEPARFPTGV